MLLVPIASDRPSRHEISPSDHDPIPIVCNLPLFSVRGACFILRAQRRAVIGDRSTAVKHFVCDRFVAGKFKRNV